MDRLSKQPEQRETEPAKVRFTLNDLSQLPNTPKTPLLTKLVECPKDSPESLKDNNHQFKREIRELGKSNAARISFLQENLIKLKDWIKTSFSVDDVDEALAADGSVGNSPTVSASVGKDDSDDAKSRSVDALQSSKPPAIRIKLVDDKMKQSNVPPSRAAPTGSKNLSRMLNRPPTCEKGVPGEKPKAANQVAINVFWNYVEPYFKAIDETDLRALEDGSRFIDPAPFTIPPLGKHYEERWRETYGYVCSGSGPKRRKAAGHGNGSEGSTGPKDVATEGHPPVRVGAIRERLLAMMIEEGNPTVPDGSLDFNNATCSSDDISVPLALNAALPGDGASAEDIANLSGSSMGSSGMKPAMTNGSLDMVPLEDRIKKDLAQSGLRLFVPHLDFQEDDEICAELRVLQRRLCEQVCLNHYRKRKLATLVRGMLGAQEFYLLLADVDKQIEQTYARRAKGFKRKARKGPSSTGSTAAKGDSDVGASTPEVLVGSPPASTGSGHGQHAGGIPLVDTRERLISAFSELVPSQREYLTAEPPAQLFDEESELQVLEYARRSGSWLPLPDNLPQNIQLLRPASHPVFPIVEQHNV